MTRLAAVADSFFKPPVRDIVPSGPGKPVEEVQRELGLERVVKLASNEGPYGPFAEALEALAAAAPDLNRYPDGGAYRLRAALAERHDVRFEEIAIGAGADGVVDALSQAELDRYFDEVSDHVLTVLDQAYFEYVDDPQYADGIEEYVKAGRRAIVLRTFSKIFGLAGLRVGYGIGPDVVVTAIGKVRRAFDITSPAQVAALASLAAPAAQAEVERRRRLNAEGRPAIEQALREHGFEPVGPAVANFLFAGGGADSRPLFEQLLREGLIVRPTHGFGAPGAIRVTVGTPEENAAFASSGALARC